MGRSDMNFHQVLSSLGRVFLLSISLILVTSLSVVQPSRQVVQMQGQWGWQHLFRGQVLAAAAASSVLLCGGVLPVQAGSYASSDSSGISFQYPDEQGLVLSPKLVKTHGTEVFLKSTTVKGLSVGVTVDPVRIGNIREFATPEGLAERVVRVEKSKEGVFEANVVSARESARPVSTADPSVPAYEIEYLVDSSRGQNHYVVKATVIDSKLYVFTVQSKEASFPALSKAAFDIISTFHVGGAQDDLSAQPL